MKQISDERIQYIDRIGELLGHQVTIVSVGPDREQTIFAVEPPSLHNASKHPTGTSDGVNQPVATHLKNTHSDDRTAECRTTDDPYRSTSRLLWMATVAGKKTESSSIRRP